MAARICDITADDPRARFCELAECGALIPGGRSWAYYATRRFCCREHSFAHRRAQPCPRCVELDCCDGHDWYETASPSGDSRACRCCKTRTAMERRHRQRPDGGALARAAHRARATPAPAPAPPQPARPVWRPNAPGWAPIEESA